MLDLFEFYLGTMMERCLWVRPPSSLLFGKSELFTKVHSPLYRREKKSTLVYTKRYINDNNIIILQ